MWNWIASSSKRWITIRQMYRGHGGRSAEHWPRLRTLMARYDQMALADASIVVMSERHPRSQVLTVDRTDFSIYRRNDRQVIDFIAPPKS